MLVVGVVVSLLATLTEKCKTSNVLFVHLRPLNKYEGSDLRLADLMVAAQNRGLTPAYFRLRSPVEAADMPISKSHCDDVVDEWMRRKKRAPKPKIIHSRSERSLEFRPELDYVTEWTSQGSFCMGVLAVLRLLAARCHRAVIAPAWFWGFDAVPGHLFPAIRQMVANADKRPRRVKSRPLLLAVSDDAHTVREEKLAKTETCAKAQLKTEQRRDKVYNMERRVYAHSDAAVFISRTDLEASRDLLPSGCAGLVCNAVPGSVAPIPENSPPWSTRQGFVFIGNGENPTNYQGILWFLRNVWPLIRIKLPDAKLHLIGRPPSQVCDEFKCHCGWGEDMPLESNGVIQLGGLEEQEMNQVLRRMRVFVVPVVSSTGVITKNFQAYIHHLPLVLTAVAAAGLDQSLDSLGAVVTSTSAEEFADAAVSVHEDENRWTQVRAAMNKFGQNWGGKRTWFDQVADFILGSGNELMV